jgi:hypothetical protein
MHVHGSRLDPNLTNLYSAAAAEKVSSAKRAAETRKALSSGASKILGELDEDTVSIVEETPEESPWARQGRKRLFSFKKKRNTDEAEGNITDDAESGVTNYVANDVATEVPADVATDVAKIVATIAARGAANGIASGVAKVVTGDPESGDPISVWG